MQEQVSIQRVLNQRLADIRARNPSFSIRNYAKKIGISPGSLSLILLGKRIVSKKLAQKIATNLLLDPQERAETLGKFPETKRVRNLKPESNYLQLNADQFHLVADWPNFAVLNLMKISTFKGDPQWIGDRLGLSPHRVDEILERLLRLGMIKKNAGGKYLRSAALYRTTDDISSVSLKRSHHQTLDLAKEALDREAVEDRDFTWLTLPFDMARMADAKTLIRKFQDDFMELVGEGAKPEEVFRLAIQFIPLTKLKKRGSK